MRTLAHLPARLSVIEVNAPAAALSAAQESLARVLPDAKVSVLLAVAESTANVMYRVRGLLFVSSLVILCIVALSVATTLYAIVIDRRRDIGVMKALGAGEGQIASLLVTESATLGAIGGVLGCALGLGAATWIGHAIYQSAGTSAISGDSRSIVIDGGCCSRGHAVSVARGAPRERGCGA